VDGDSIYAWQVQEPDGKWSIVAASVPSLGNETWPLIHRDMAFVKHRLKPLAEQHAQLTGQPLRLARFNLVEVLDG
jgi:hypothetical protein